MKRKFASTFASAILPIASLTLATLLTGCGSSGNNAAIVPGVVGIGGGGCAPITAPQLTFTGSNILLQSPRSIVAGLIPGYGQAGQLISGPGAGAALQQYTNTYAPSCTTGYCTYANQQYYIVKQGVDGTNLQMNLTVNSATGVAQSTGNLTGSVSFGQNILQILMDEVQNNPGKYSLSGTSTSCNGGYCNGGGFNGGYYSTPYGQYSINPSQVCISGLAFQGDVAQPNGPGGQNYLINANWYVYLNNTQHGVQVTF